MRGRLSMITGRVTIPDKLVDSCRSFVKGIADPVIYVVDLCNVPRHELKQLMPRGTKHTIAEKPLELYEVWKFINNPDIQGDKVVIIVSKRHTEYSMASLSINLRLITISLEDELCKCTDYTEVG